MSTTPYRESQVGWLFLSIMILTWLFVVWRAVPQVIERQGVSIPLVSVSLIFLIICLLFYRLDSTISYRKIILIYGIGLIKIQPKVDELVSLEITKIPIWYGPGIKMTSKGWMYNIQGRDVVVLTYRKGSITESIMIGTAQPAQLKKSLMENFELMQNPTV